MTTLNCLDYRPDVSDILRRLRSLYSRTAGDRIFATMSVPNTAIDKFARTYSHGECTLPDLADRVNFWDEYLQQRSVVEDDSMPAAYLSELDQGLYGGLLGAEVRFMADPATGWISSMVPPLLKNWSDFKQLRFDQTHHWWERYRHQLDVFVAASRGKWGISHFILIDALNFIFELIGATQTYLSLDEHPDMVRQAIDFAFDLNVRVQQLFFETVPSLEGGTFSNFAQWLPGRIVSESIDPYHMTSVACFERWGREPAERIMNHFDGGVIHIHGNGRHLLEAAATIKGLKTALLMDDRGFPAAFDAIADLKARMNDVPVAVFAEHGKFAERLERRDLPGGVMYQVQNVPDAATANRLMEKVRKYRV